MASHDQTNWKGYSRPDCKLTLRITPDAHTVANAMIHDFHAAVAEKMLEHRGIVPELLLYVVGIGRAVR